MPTNSFSFTYRIIVKQTIKLGQGPFLLFWKTLSLKLKQSQETLVFNVWNWAAFDNNQTIKKKKTLEFVPTFCNTFFLLLKQNSEDHNFHWGDFMACFLAGTASCVLLEVLHKEHRMGLERASFVASTMPYDVCK